MNNPESLGTQDNTILQRRKAIKNMLHIFESRILFLSVVVLLNKIKYAYDLTEFT